MKYTFSTIILTVWTLLGITVFGTPVHASILDHNFIQEKITSSRGNIFQNRNDRNQLLSEIKKPQIKPLTAEERQTQFVQQLPVILANYQNIYDRIASSTLLAVANGQDTSDIDTLLSSASSTLVEASSTISSLASTTLDMFTIRTATVTSIRELNSIKEILQEATNDLKQII